MLFGFLFLLGHFVTVFAEIYEAADGWHGGGRDFNQVHGMMTRKVQRLGERDDAELIAIHPDDADFAGADFAVDPDKRSRRGITWGKRAAQDTLDGCSINLKFRIKQTGTAS